VLTAPVLPAPTVLMCGAVPALEVLFVDNAGGEIVAVLQALLDTLQAALCTTSYGYLYACEEYHTVRRQLWAHLGDSICGFPMEAWNSTCVPPSARDGTCGVNVRDMTPAQALEFLLSRCVTTYTGDLGSLVSGTTPNFMALSSRSRTDVSAVLAANALKAGLPAASASARPLHTCSWSALARCCSSSTTPNMRTRLTCSLARSRARSLASPSRQRARRTLAPTRPSYPSPRPCQSSAASRR
jgi:hypothetical protein